MLMAAGYLNIVVVEIVVKCFLPTTRHLLMIWTCVQICLDEAQMVECTTTKVYTVYSIL